MPKSDLTNGRPQAFAVSEIERGQGFIYTLFALEDLYGLKIELVDSEAILRVNSKGTERPDTSELLSIQSEQAAIYDKYRYNYPKKGFTGYHFKAAISNYQENFAKSDFMTGKYNEKLKSGENLTLQGKWECRYGQDGLKACAFVHTICPHKQRKNQNM